MSRHPSWLILQNDKQAFLGMIPLFLDLEDERPAAEQFDDNYRHGGGWRPIPKFMLLGGGELRYPGDEPMHPIAVAMLRDEVIYVYDYGFVCVAQLNTDEKITSFEVSRMD